MDIGAFSFGKFVLAVDIERINSSSVSLLILTQLSLLKQWIKPCNRLTLNEFGVKFLYSLFKNKKPAVNLRSSGEVFNCFQWEDSIPSCILKTGIK